MHKSSSIYRITKKMVADFYKIEERTIERLLEEHGDEFNYDDYVLREGNHLKKFKVTDEIDAIANGPKSEVFSMTWILIIESHCK